MDDALYVRGRTLSSRGLPQGEASEVYSLGGVDFRGLALTHLALTLRLLGFCM